MEPDDGKESTATQYGTPGNVPLYTASGPGARVIEPMWWIAVTMRGQIRRVKAKDKKEALIMAQRGGFRIKTIGLDRQ